MKVRHSRLSAAVAATAVAFLALTATTAAATTDPPPDNQNVETYDGPQVPTSPQQAIAPSAILLGAGREITGVIGSGTSWAGLLQNTGGLPVPATRDFVCIQTGYLAPTLPVKHTGWVENGPLAWALTTQEGVRDGVTPDTLGVWAHIDEEIDGGRPAAERVEAWKQAIAGQAPDIAARLVELHDQGVKLAGPYTFDIKVTPTEDANIATIDVAILSAKGNKVPGYTINLDTGSDLIVFDGGGRATSVTSGETASTLTVRTIGGPAPVLNLTVSAEGLPSTQLAIGVPTDPGNHQTVIAAAAPVSIQGAATAQLAYDFNPQGESNAPVTLSRGQERTDEFTAQAAPGQTWLNLPDGTPVPVTYQWVMYDVAGISDVDFANLPDTVHADAPELARGTQTLTDGQHVSVSGGPATSEESVVTVWSTSKDLAPDDTIRSYIRGPWTDGWQLTETSLVKYPTKLTSTARLEETVDAFRLVDQTWFDLPKDHGKFNGVTGRWESDAKDVTTTVYHFKGERPGPDSCTPDHQYGEAYIQDAQRGYDEISDMSWNFSPTVTVEEWIVPVHSYPGDARTEPYTSGCDDPAQMIHRTPTPIKVTTKANATTGQAPVVGDGGRLFDTHIVAGTVHEGDAGYSVLYWAKTGTKLTCTPDQIVYEGTTLVTYTNGAGEYRMAEGDDYDYNSPDGIGGTYSYAQYSIDADGAQIASEPCGADSQTVTVADSPTAPTPTPTPAPTAPAIASPHLAQTGTDPLMWVALAVALAVSGVVIMVVRRHRISSH